VNRISTIITKGAARLELRAWLAATIEAVKRCPSLSSILRKREPQAPKGLVIAARIIMILAGVLFFTEAVLLLTAGWMNISLGLILIGSALAFISLGLVWLGGQRSCDDTCNKPLVWIAEFLTRIIG
jgi:hypothetical protein